MRRAELELAGAMILGVLLAVIATCQPAHGQSVTSLRFAAVRDAGRMDTVAQDLLWSASGFVPDSFRVTFGWSAWGREVDRPTGALPPVMAQRTLSLPGWARKRTLLWQEPYGKTITRWACVVGYKNGRPVGTTATATMPSWTRERFAAVPPFGTADSAFLSTVPTTVDTVAAVAVSSPTPESFRFTSSAFTLPAGTYTFTVRADDGVRIWLDGVLLIDQYRPQGPTTFTATTTVAAGPHRLLIHYFNNDGTGLLTLAWASAAPTAPATGDCAGTRVAYDAWVPWRDVLFAGSIDSATMRNGTLVVLAGWLPKRLTPAADTACRAAAINVGLSSILDLRTCWAQADTAGAHWCLAVMDSAHSWGAFAKKATDMDAYTLCDKTLFRAVRGVRIVPPVAP